MTEQKRVASGADPDGEGKAKRITVRLTSRNDGSAKWRNYLVPYDDRSTVLDALEHIRVHEEPDLMYRRSCHHGSCGTCTCKVDGKEVLACRTRITELDGEDLRIEPLSEEGCIADLVVDREPFFQAIPAGLDYLRPSDVSRPSVAVGPGADPQRFENCIECGACVSACPVTAEFRGPAALAAISRHVHKHPEQEGAFNALVDGPDGVWACEEAFECSRICPASVFPSKHIIDLKRRLRKE